MEYRSLGKTGIRVSEIGFGTWGIGGATEGATSYGDTDDAVSLEALRHALEKGITFYDTSNIYGYGHAEELLAKAFAGKRHDVVIATKVGFTKHGGPHDVAPAYIRKCLEESLRRLGTDYVDVYQFHSVPLQQIRDTEGCLETMRELKKEGKIRAIGYSVKDPADVATVIEEFGAESVQANFNLIDQRILRTGGLEVARKNGTGLIARTPFCFGFLTGSVTQTVFDPKDHRSTWSREQIEKWKEAPKIFSRVDGENAYTPAQLALRFCISYPEISTVIPGMMSVKEVDENCSVEETPNLNEAQREVAERLSRENTFFVGK